MATSSRTYFSIKRKNHYLEELLHKKTIIDEEDFHVRCREIQSSITNLQGNINSSKNVQLSKSSNIPSANLVASVSNFTSSPLGSSPTSSRQQNSPQAQASSQQQSSQQVQDKCLVM